MLKLIDQTLFAQIGKRLAALYGSEQAPQLQRRLYHMIGRYGVGAEQQPCAEQPAAEPQPQPHWDESDAYLITYADMVQESGQRPLRALRDFCNAHLKGAVSTVHILPFCPWSSDDGFSVIDYRAVDPAYGKWEDVRALGKHFSLMFDLVLNHCSSQSQWFRDFLTGIDPARNYFLPVDPKTDLSAVTRPRTSPLLTRTVTREGEAWVWTTFSADQVDLNWRCPDLLFEFIDILFAYIAHGARTIRLDAIAFLWKEPGSSCLHLPQTHELVKLLRDICALVAPQVLLLTETNVPHEENISYFGSGDEAHIVYNFSLPPLLLHALLTENTKYLQRWASQLQYPQQGCTYLNFTASHDGIGVRPAQGLLPQREFDKLIQQVQERGGKVSARTLPDGSQAPYELNITYASALTTAGEPEDLSIARFLCSQAVALAFKGIPAVYFHSLLGTPSCEKTFASTGRARSLNRRKYQAAEIAAILESPDSPQAKIFQRYTQLLRRRAHYPAFHPDGAQRVYESTHQMFILERTSPDGAQSVLCVFNFSAEEVVVKNPQHTELLRKAKGFYDIVSGKTYSSGVRGITLQPFQALWLLPRDE